MTMTDEVKDVLRERLDDAIEHMESMDDEIQVLELILKKAGESGKEEVKGPLDAYWDASCLLEQAIADLQGYFGREDGP